MQHLLLAIMAAEQLSSTAKHCTYLISNALSEVSARPVARGAETCSTTALTVSHGCRAVSIYCACRVVYLPQNTGGACICIVTSLKNRVWFK